jgi:hypothetical protein
MKATRKRHAYDFRDLAYGAYMHLLRIGRQVEMPWYEVGTHRWVIVETIVE